MLACLYNMHLNVRFQFRVQFTHVFLKKIIQLSGKLNINWTCTHNHKWKQTPLLLLWGAWKASSLDAFDDSCSYRPCMWQFLQEIAIILSVHYTWCIKSIGTWSCCKDHVVVVHVEFISFEGVCAGNCLVEWVKFLGLCLQIVDILDVSNILLYAIKL